MRGKATAGTVGNPAPGITPAYAGKRLPYPPRVGYMRDHPRVCGEKYIAVSLSHGVKGSPPHVRGKARPTPAAGMPPGITPACAGKRWRFGWIICRTQDHPRMCGEKSRSELYSAPMKGSPPHVRGKEIRVSGNGLQLRITPACAGKSCSTFVFQPLIRDHPRMCGEKHALACRSHLYQGSPPHVRGKDMRRTVNELQAGITPACAGKRLKRSRSTVPHAAIVPLFPSVCNKPAGSDGSPAGHDAPPFLPIENAAPASPAYNLRSL